MAVKDIVSALQGTPNNPIDLTCGGDQSESYAKAVEIANHTSMKYLYFSENVRPAYFGTFTAPLSLGKLQKLARNPRARLVHDLSYDYDSEAEWEEEDGDDVASEGDDEDDLDEGEDETDRGFIDDAEFDAPLLKRDPLSGTELMPVCTGIHWEDKSGVLHPADITAATLDFSAFEMEYLLRKYSCNVDNSNALQVLSLKQ
jgi:chromatin assembly factor 1 subunit A